MGLGGKSKWRGEEREEYRDFLTKIRGLDRLYTHTSLLIPAIYLACEITPTSNGITVR